MGIDLCVVICGRVGFIVAEGWRVMPFGGVGVGPEVSLTLNVGYVPQPTPGTTYSVGCPVAYFGGGFGEIGWSTTIAWDHGLLPNQPLPGSEIGIAVHKPHLPRTVRAVLILIGVNCLCVVARVFADFGAGEPQLSPSLPPSYYVITAVVLLGLNLLIARLVVRGARVAPYLVMLLAAGDLSAFIATLDLLTFVAATVTATAGALMWPRASLEYATAARAALKNRKSSL